MTNRQRWLVVSTTIALALSAGVYLAKQQIPAMKLTADAYHRLLASQLADSEGKPHRLEQWRGKTLIVNFWATWCPPCREEMPALSRFQTTNVTNGVQVVGIAVDSAANVNQYRIRNKTAYPLLIGDATTGELMRLMGNTQGGLPYTVIFGPDGTARMAHLGKISEKALDQAMWQP